MNDGPGEEPDEIDGLVEEVWDGRGSWLGGGVVVAFSPDEDGDVVLTLPPHAVLGTRVADGWLDLAVPLLT